MSLLIAHLLTAAATAPVSPNLAKTWPFGAALLAVVALFLYYIDRTNERNRKAFEAIAARTNDVTDQQNRTLETVTNALAENTRAIDRLTNRIEP